MKTYCLKYSVLCLTIILGTAAHGDASSMVLPKLANNNLKLINVIFRPGYSVHIENEYNTQFYILPDTYSEIKINATFENDPIPDIPCSPRNLEIRDGDFLYISVTSHKNKPDKPICTLSITRNLTPIIKIK